MRKTKILVMLHIETTKNKKGLVTINQHEVANHYHLNSGVISKVIKDFVDDGKLRKVSPHGPGRPAVYKVVGW